MALHEGTLIIWNSQVYLEQGIDRWTGVEDAIHWTLPLVYESEDG